MAVTGNNYVAGRPGQLGFAPLLFQPLPGFFSAALPVVAAAPNNFVDVPGPPVGSIRVFDQIQAVSATLAAPLATVTGAIRQPGPVTWPLTNVLSGGASLQVSCQVLGFGEVCRITNGGANAGSVVATYVDIPDTRITLIRQTVTAVYAPVIPAPAAGAINRFLQVATMTSQIRQVQSRIVGFNDDTISHSLEFRYGGRTVSRGAAATTKNVMTLSAPQNLPVVFGGGPLEIALAEAVATLPGNITGAYETLPL